MTQQLSAQLNILPEEYKVIRRIRELWAKDVPDPDVRELLGLTTEDWTKFIRLMKELGESDTDNHVAYEKYKAKQIKRKEDLKHLRNYAESQDELGTAIKCIQLESEIDRSFIDYGQKLNVLKGEVIGANINIQTNLQLNAIFAHLEPEKQKAAQEELNEMVQMLLAEGVTFDGNAGKEGDKS